MEAMIDRIGTQKLEEFRFSGIRSANDDEEEGMGLL